MRLSESKRSVAEPISWQSGVTLIELLIVVVIIGILAAIAIPSYQQHVIKGKRADAKAVLSENANWLERNYTASGCYNYGNVTDCQAQSGTATVLPTTASPKTGAANYKVSIAYASSGQQYTLTATPCGDGGAGCPSGSTTFTDSECGALTLDSLGQQGEGGSQDVAYCWQR